MEARGSGGKAAGTRRFWKVDVDGVDHIRASWMRYAQCWHL
jgi:hypothetical protein